MDWERTHNLPLGVAIIIVLGIVLALLRYVLQHYT